MSEQLINTPGVFGENGNFLLERELGSGGMGGVYMGRDKMLDRPIAVKVMLKELGDDPEFVEKFKKEAQSAAKLIHPNIAQIYSYGICDGMPYMAMELAAGGSLFTLMNANPGKTDIARVLKICQQVAMALQCASDQGYVHGDIKPENILFDANGNAKLVDFGLAAMQKDTDEIWGTPYYISPEKVKKEPVDMRADMYSLGGTLYHALTGVAPFEGDDPIAVVKKRFEGAPKKPSEIRPEITPAVDQLVMTMLELDKEKRYPTFEALLEAFRNVLTNGLNADTAAAPAKPAAAAAAKTTAKTRTGKRIMMRPRRAAMMKKATPASATASEENKPNETDEGISDISSDNASDLPPADISASTSEEEEEEEGGNIGLKILIVIGSIILGIALIAGLVVWYRVSSKNSAAEAERQDIVTKAISARAAIKDTVEKAVKFQEEFDTFSKRAIDECQKPTDELIAILPAEVASTLKPDTSKELEDAKALEANDGKPVEVAPPPAPVAAPSSKDTNAVAVATVSTNAVQTAVQAGSASNAPPAKSAAPAAPAKAAPTKAAEPAKAKEQAPAPAAAAPQKEVPQVVKDMQDIWNRAYSCQASAIRIRLQIKKIKAKGAEAANYSEDSFDNMQKLAELSRTVASMLDDVRASKDVENVRKGITYIKSKGEKIVQQTTKRLRIEKLENDRKAKAEAAAAAEKERLEKAEAARKAKVEEETTAAKTKFEDLAVNIRQFDWKTCMLNLNIMKADFTTPEGQLAADLELRKIQALKFFQDTLIRGLKGHSFKAKIKGMKGCKIDTISDSEIQILKPNGKGRMRFTWPKFFKECPGALNEAMNEYVMKAHEPNAKRRLNLKDWSKAMVGSAYILKIVCADVNGAVQKAEQMIKEVAEKYPDYVSELNLMFPDLGLGEGEAKSDDAE